MLKLIKERFVNVISCCHRQFWRAFDKTKITHSPLSHPIRYFRTEVISILEHEWHQWLRADQWYHLLSIINLSFSIEMLSRDIRYTSTFSRIYTISSSLQWMLYCHVLLRYKLIVYASLASTLNRVTQAGVCCHTGILLFGGKHSGRNPETQTT